MKLTPALLKLIAALLIALVALLAVFALLGLLVSEASTLMALGFIAQIWYLMVLLLGLAAATCLFVAFKSYATYSGKGMGGKLQFGGPGVLMMVVVFSGFHLAPVPAADFDVTVYLHNAQQQPLSQRTGRVLLRLGDDLRQEAVGAKGTVRFMNIPARFRHRRVDVMVSDVSEFDDFRGDIVLDQEAVTLRLTPSKQVLDGEVLDTQGQPVVGAEVLAANLSAHTDQHGRFHLVFPRPVPAPQRTLRIRAPGKHPWRGRFVSNGERLHVVLKNQ